MTAIGNPFGRANTITRVSEPSKEEKALIKTRLGLSTENLNNILKDYTRVNAYHQQTSFTHIKKLDSSIDHLLNGVYSVLKVVTDLNQLPVCRNSKELRESVNEVSNLGRKVHTLVNKLARKSPNTQKPTTKPLLSDFSSHKFKVTIKPPRKEPPEIDKAPIKDRITFCKDTLSEIFRDYIYFNNFHQNKSYAYLNANPEVSYFDRGTLLTEAEVIDLDNSTNHLLDGINSVKASLNELNQLPICHLSEELYESVRHTWDISMSIQKDIKHMAELSPNKIKEEPKRVRFLLGNFQKVNPKHPDVQSFKF